MVQGSLQNTHSVASSGVGVQTGAGCSVNFTSSPRGRKAVRHSISFSGDQERRDLKERVTAEVSELLALLSFWNGKLWNVSSLWDNDPQGWYLSVVLGAPFTISAQCCTCVDRLPETLMGSIGYDVSVLTKPGTATWHSTYPLAMRKHCSFFSQFFSSFSKPKDLAINTQWAKLVNTSVRLIMLQHFYENSEQDSALLMQS